MNNTDTDTTPQDFGKTRIYLPSQANLQVFSKEVCTWSV